MSIKITEPRPLKAKLLAWSELNVNEVDLLTNSFRSHSILDIYSFLEKFFDLSSSSPREKILLDLYFYAIKFTLENNFSKIQISTFISILRSLHRVNQETPFDNESHLLAYFKELIIIHSIKRPPFCVDIFDNQTVVKVVNYITNTYLKHYHLYKYAFTPIVGLDLDINYSDSLGNSKFGSKQPTALENDNEAKSIYPTEVRSNDETAREKIDRIEEPSAASVNMKAYIRNIIQDHLNSKRGKSLVDELTGVKTPKTPKSAEPVRNIRSGSNKK